jgi:hypothetical protein
VGLTRSEIQNEKRSSKKPVSGQCCCFHSRIRRWLRAWIPSRLWAISTTHCEGPHDLCDGGAMAAGFMWYLSAIASAFLAVLAGISTYLLIWLKTRRQISN